MADKSQQIATYAGALGGLLGSTIGKCLVHPIDTVKAKLQVLKPERVTGSYIAHVARKTVAEEGMRGLYRGYAVHIIGSIPAAGLYFGGYEFFKSRTLQIQFFQDHSFLSFLAGGMFAEAIACTIFVPVDVIKERRQV